MQQYCTARPPSGFFFKARLARKEEDGLVANANITPIEWYLPGGPFFQGSISPQRRRWLVANANITPIKWRLTGGKIFNARLPRKEEDRRLSTLTLHQSNGVSRRALFERSTTGTPYKKKKTGHRQSMLPQLRSTKPVLLWSFFF